jgi:hypothetical protein
VRTVDGIGSASKQASKRMGNFRMFGIMGAQRHIRATEAKRWKERAEVLL